MLNAKNSKDFGAREIRARGVTILTLLYETKKLKRKKKVEHEKLNFFFFSEIEK